MAAVEDFSRLVSGIYAAAAAPQHWEAALRDIRRTLGALQAGLFMDDAAWSTLSVDAAHSYAEYYHRFDHVFADLQHGPVGEVRTGTELMPLVRKSEFCDWLRPLDIDDGLFVRLTGGPTPVCFMVGAPRRTEAFDTPERVQLISGLVSHLQQALRTQDKLAALAECTGELADALEVVRHGVVVVAGEHLVTNLNSAAERILRAEDGLAIRSGRIAATTAHADQELHCAVQDALVAERLTVRTGRSLTCVRPSGKRPYIIHVQPPFPRNGDEPRRQPMALLLIIDPEDEPEPDTALLRRLYGLTNAEADVAIRVMHGADPREIAQGLSISVPTVRTHLQHAFDKTDTHRQAELVRLLLALTP